MDESRREFLKATGTAAAAGLVVGAMSGMSSVASAEAQNPNANDQPVGALTAHILPKLPYPYDGLEPYIDAETVNLHYTKHHQGYVNGLNEAELALGKARALNDYALVDYWSKKAAFNGGGHFLHSLFWLVMAPAGKGGGGDPKGALAEKIKEDFGTFGTFKSQFSATAKSVEGGGWAILHYRHSDRRLVMMQAENQHKLTQWNVTPILALDVWEHAYYLKYRNRRDNYINEWWNLVNWDQVAQNYREAAQ